MITHYTKELVNSIIDNISEALGDNFRLDILVGDITNATHYNVHCIHIATVEMFGRKVVGIFDEDSRYVPFSVKWGDDEHKETLANRILDEISNSFLISIPPANQFACLSTCENRDSDEVADFLRIAKKMKPVDIEGMTTEVLGLTLAELSVGESATADEMEYFFCINPPCEEAVKAKLNGEHWPYSVNEWSGLRGEYCPACDCSHTHPVRAIVGGKNKYGHDDVRYVCKCDGCGKEFVIVG